jgi:hypothetical protein
VKQSSYRRGPNLARVFIALAPLTVTKERKGAMWHKAEK